MDVETLVVLYIAPAVMLGACLASGVYEYIIIQGRGFLQGLKDWLTDDDFDDWW